MLPAQHAPSATGSGDTSCLIAVILIGRWWSRRPTPQRPGLRFLWGWRSFAAASLLLWSMSFVRLPLTGHTLTPVASLRYARVGIIAAAAAAAAASTYMLLLLLLLLLTCKSMQCNAMPPCITNS